MRKIKTSSAVCLMFGVILLLLGMIQPYQYDQAAKNGYRVNAVVTNVKEKGSLDLKNGITQTEYVIYGEYMVNGYQYGGIELCRTSVPYKVGDVIPVVVNPDNPGKTMAAEGVLAVIGLITIAVGILWIIRDKKAAAQAQ